MTIRCEYHPAQWNHSQRVNLLIAFMGGTPLDRIKAGLKAIVFFSPRRFRFYHSPFYLMMCFEGDK